MTIVGNSKSLARLGQFLNQKIHRGVFNRQNLLLTNCLISTLMGTVGDCVQQNYDILSSKLADDKDGERPKFNYVRSAHMSAAGLTTGCLTHYWYIYLDRFMGRGRTQKLVLKKVLIDQIVFSPINLICYFGTVGLLERRSLRYIYDEFKQKGMGNIYLVEWGIWPAAQYVNFYLLPMRYRILFDNVISFFFDVYSPFVKYKTELEGQSADEPSSKQAAGEKVQTKSASERTESKCERRDKSEQREKSERKDKSERKEKSEIGSSGHLGANQIASQMAS